MFKSQMVSRRRNRSLAAHDMAMARLSSPVVTDNDVLDVLRHWLFKRGRAAGREEKKDVLGLIRRQDGRVAVSKVTRKSPAVFALLSRWIEDNMPNEFKEPFHFTTIHISTGYRYIESM